MRYLGICCLVAGCLLSLTAAKPGDAILVAEIDGSINPVSKDYFLRVLELAAEENATLVILRLDTPGGLVNPTKDMVGAILNSDIPVVAFVGPAGAWAASAGTFITMSAHLAVMAKGSTIGAAHPVSATGQAGDEEDAGTKKTVNFLAEWSREVAKKRGRDPDWAEKAVRSSESIGWEEALELTIIDLAVEDFDDLLVQLDGYVLADGTVLSTAGADVETVPMSGRERFLDYLANPSLVYVLFLVGIYGIIFELFSPGIGFGLIAGGICLLCAFLGLQILPISYVGVSLILFGALLMVLDFFYTQTNGILTTGGIVALLVGSFTLFDFQGIEDPVFRLPWWHVLISVGTIGGFFLVIVTRGLFSKGKQLVLDSRMMVGSLGQAKGELRSDLEAMVLVQGEYWRAFAAGDPIGEGEQVEVTEVRDGRLIVRPAHPGDLDAGDSGPGSDTAG
jgi:membrane-bound serine protease (ClpP class)